MDQSDWDTVTVIRKNKPAVKTTSANSVINEARRTGNVLSVEKKYAAGHNKAGATKSGLNAAKLDAETGEDMSLPQVSTSVAKTIQKARQAAGLTQKELGTKINEKAQVVQDYEQARDGMVPNQAILAKFERALGVKLRGKDIGAPLVRGKKNKK